MSVQISARAQSGLEIIYALLCVGKSPEIADGFLEAARQAVQFLSQNPLAGPHPRWATRHRSLRFWAISRTNYLINYLADERGVRIKRVLVGRRDVARIMELGKENPSSLEE